MKENLAPEGGTVQVGGARFEIVSMTGDVVPRVRFWWKPWTWCRRPLLYRSVYLQLRSAPGAPTVSAMAQLSRELYAKLGAK